MKLRELKISNFRAYASETIIKLDDLSVFVGCNDAGKSSILEALDIFFNDSQIGKDDCCVHTGNSEIMISCAFDDLPNKILIDAQHPTNLRDEHLLREDGMLEICRVFLCSSEKGKVSREFLKAFHPTATNADELLTMTNIQLKNMAKTVIKDETTLATINMSINSEIRKAIKLSVQDLNLKLVDLDLKKEDGKKIWEKLQMHLPTFALFKSDRSSTDQDSEAQDPMKIIIKEAIKKQEVMLSNLVDTIKNELDGIAKKTVEKIQEMSPELAKELNPRVIAGKWDSIFKVSLEGDDRIPINKRGSGTRRLVLLNFFRAQAETKNENKEPMGSGIIYAIEEPETSQHPNHQKLLLDAFEDLISSGNCQIILTTHTPNLARKFNQKSLRLILKNGNNSPEIFEGNQEDVMPKISKTLGILPDHDVKVFLGVEGKHDIEFLRRISKILSQTEPDIPDLDQSEKNGHLIFVPLGGSSLELWVSRLAGLNRQEFYITDRDDRDKAKYQEEVDAWNARENCQAWITSKKELENYLHSDAIKSQLPTYKSNGDDFDNVPNLYAKAAFLSEDNPETKWVEYKKEELKKKESRAKAKLNTVCVDNMTAQWLTEIDTHDDIRTWLRNIGKYLN